MRGDDIPAADQIVRYVKPRMLREDGTVDGADFRLRSNRPDEYGLSVNWLEVIAPCRSTQLAEVRRLCRLNLRKNGRFAELNVGTVLKMVAEVIETLRVVHDPLDANDGFEADYSHAQLTGLPPGDSDEAMLVGDMISECVTFLHPAIVDE